MQNFLQEKEYCNTLLTELGACESLSNLPQSVQLVLTMYTCKYEMES